VTPEQVTLEADALSLAFPDGVVRLSARTLRAACRCAPCRARERAGEPVEPSPSVSLCELVPVGAYAAQLRFSDGHDRGIYPWVYLRELAQASS